jgi:serine/threonine protein kinase
MLQTEQVLQGRYQLKKQLGKNAGRQTWLAKNLEAKSIQLVIVKLLAFNPQMQWEELKLFEREAQVLKHLNHPRIPRNRDYFSIDSETGDGLPWFGLVQDYIPGDSLQQLLDKGKRFTEAQVRKIATEVLEILIYLHELSPPILHRDIKPSNLIWGRNRQIYLVDFGAVQDRATAEGVTFTVVGTSGYAPPEQLWGRAVAASDLYALGATLIHLLTGTPPADLPQDNLRIQFADRVSLNSGFADWLEQLTEPAPERRYSTARQALEALKASASLPSPIEDVKTSHQPAKTSVVPAVLTLEVIVALLAILAIIALPPSTFTMVSKAKQAEGKQNIGALNRAQQAYYLENNAFTNSIEKLGIGIKTQTENYKYSIRATPKAIFNYGVARNNTIKSYVGGVFAVPAKEIPNSKSSSQDEILTLSIVCETNSRGSSRPAEPIYKNGELACGSGTRELGTR